MLRARVGQYLIFFAPLAVATSVLALHGSSRAAPSDSVMTFQARITQDATPLSGDLDLRLEIWTGSSAAGSTLVWTEDQNAVPVRNGIVSVKLGSVVPLTATLFEPGTSRFVAIRLRPAGTDLVTPFVELTAVPYALNMVGSASPGVPIGTIVDWFRPDTTTPVPGGWWVCDGSEVTDTAAVLFLNKRVPDLRNMFVAGLNATNLVDGVPSTYGAVPAPGMNLTVQGGPNTVNVAHTHTVSSSGAHRHTLPTGTGEITYNPSTPAGRLATTVAAGQSGGDGSHTHTTQSALGSFDNRPSFIGLLKIIRIK